MFLVKGGMSFQILGPCMEKLSFENKELYLLGDYNIDLLKTDDDNIDEYFNIITSIFMVSTPPPPPPLIKGLGIGQAPEKLLNRDKVT